MAVNYYSPATPRSRQQGWAATHGGNQANILNARAFCGPESSLDSARAIESTRFMVGAVGIELLIQFTNPHFSNKK
jgi:hypothetical protein